MCTGRASEVEINFDFEIHAVHAVHAVHGFMQLQKEAHLSIFFLSGECCHLLGQAVLISRYTGSNINNSWTPSRTADRLVRLKL